MIRPLSVYSMTKGWRQIAVGLNYLVNKTGPGSDNHLQAGAFLSSREGLDRPDIQLHFVNALSFDHANVTAEQDGFMIHSCQLRPESKGSIALRSSDPFDAPKIDPNYLATEEDRRVMREGLKIMRDVIKQDAFAPYRGPEMSPGTSVKTDEDIDKFIRENAETIYHPVGTVRMGADEKAPLDGDLRVRGVTGLRVVDASVMPTLIGGNTNAPTIMIAEKAADKIRGRKELRPAEQSFA